MKIDFDSLNEDLHLHATKTYGLYHNWTPEQISQYVSQLVQSWEIIEDMAPWEPTRLVAFFTALKLRMEMEREVAKQKVPHFHWISECYQDHWDLVDCKMRIKDLAKL